MFLASTFILMALFSGAYTLSIIDSSHKSTANFPGREIAEFVTQHWHDRYQTKLAYVAGSRWVGGNIHFYSLDHPSVFVDWSKRHAAWIDIDDLKKKGAVFIWELTANETLPDYIRKQFSTLQNPEIFEFELKRNRRNLPPIKIGIAFLPPAASVKA